MTGLSVENAFEKARTTGNLDSLGLVRCDRLTSNWAAAQALGTSAAC